MDWKRRNRRNRKYEGRIMNFSQQQRTDDQTYLIWFWNKF
jgi:hypothetical protein